MRSCPRVVLAVVLLLAALAGCGGGPPRLDDDRLVATLRDRLDAQGVRADDLACPDLPAEVGRSARCTFTVDGQPVDAVATVARVDGETVTYDVRTEARPASRAVLEPAVGRTLAGTGVPPGAVACSADLAPRPGATVTCTLTADGAATEWVVTTTSVDGGRIDYSLRQAGLP